MTEVQRLADWTIMSDIDGTLINADGTIPQRNVEAIRRFADKGGRFAIATGRSPQWARFLAEQLPIGAPCVCCNGGVLYDFARNETLMELTLPEHAKAYVDIISQAPFPVGLVVMTRNEYYNVCLEESLVGELLKLRQSNFRDMVDWRGIEEDWYKLLIILPERCHEQCLEFLAQHEFPGVRFAVTTYTLVEMLPELSSKGYALERLMEQRDLTRDTLAVIGDFYNDLEMIQLAGVGATLCDSPEDIKACADFVAGPCGNGAVADLIEYLEARCK